MRYKTLPAEGVYEFFSALGALKSHLRFDPRSTQTKKAILSDGSLLFGGGGGDRTRVRKYSA